MNDSLGPLGRRSVLLGAGIAAVPLLARAQSAAGNTQITVDRARTAPIPIAIPSLAGTPLGAQIADVISNDLGRSGLFRPIGAAAQIGANDAGDTPNFQNWKAVGAQALVTGKVEGGGSNVRVEFRLWDVLPGQQIQGTAYTTTSTNWRRIAHIISDVIYERLLGEKGYFDTRIVYVASSGPRVKRIKRLAIMDQDSENNRFLTDGSWLVLTPRFHPTRDQIVYMSYYNNRPRVWTFDLGSGRQTVLGDFDGMTFAPRYAPDGNTIIMSVARGAGSDIVTVGTGGGRPRALTNSGAIDTSPCYSPDGSQIVFNSDRGGDQQLYIMGAGGGSARRISYGKGRYATPVWSPRGDLIAFTRLGAEGFAIGVMRPDGSGERILSESFDVEGPTFCPNGRVLMFFREAAGGAGSRLVSIDITGFNERVVPTPTDASAPAWSPLLA
ncbi:MAG: Tol-Pal system beta propeller repeat protein TolB [Acetobacteraceae bacterium]|nr:Tol-Pal system beta propeller repeat protein TolB [Acetobacteraceae bacterium]